MKFTIFALLVLVPCSLSDRASNYADLGKADVCDLNYSKIDYDCDNLYHESDDLCDHLVENAEDSLARLHDEINSKCKRVSKRECRELKEGFHRTSGRILHRANEKCFEKLDVVDDSCAKRYQKLHQPCRSIYVKLGFRTCS